jgi:hypothetical protein
MPSTKDGGIWAYFWRKRRELRVFYERLVRKAGEKTFRAAGGSQPVSVACPSLPAGEY